MKKLVLIDSNALVHRAFHALPPLTTPDGRPSNAVYGFISVLIRMLQDIKPDYVAATFDLAGPTFRHTEYEQYKAQRVKAPDELYAQIPMVKEMLAAFGIPVFEAAGFEADDVIGTIAENSKKLPDVQTIIVTGDLDTLQLVHDKKTIIFTLRKGVTDTVTYDEDAVHERYGLSPEQIPDFKGLKGDPSDNIPGVFGIGEKTASTLIQKFGSLETLYEKLAKSDVSDKLKAKLTEEKDMALFSKKLATIIRDVPLDFSIEKADWLNHLDMPALENKCREFGFTSLVKRLANIVKTPTAETASRSLDLDQAGQTKIPISIAVSAADVPAAQTAAIHVVFDGPAPIALYIAQDEKKVWLIKDPDASTVSEVLVKFPALVVHNIKPLLRYAGAAEKMLGRDVFDTMIASWLINPEARDYSLDRLYQTLTGEILDENEESRPAALLRLHGLAWDKLKELGMAELYSDIEAPLIGILADMESEGIRVNTHTIDELLKVAGAETSQLEKKIYKLAGGEFNINSPSQLADILFVKLAVRGRVRRTSGGAPSTAAPELEKLRDEHPIIALILDYRELAKMKNTYIEPFPMLVANDGRIHTTYNQTGTATGRLSSSDPNLQNIPTRTELGQKFRAAFVTDPGWKLLSLDYSQLELRLVAHIAHDKTMIEAFHENEDIHTRTASEVFGVAPIQVTKDMRRQAKVLNFGIIYGMGALGFARAAGINREQAKRFIDEYFTRFSGVARYMEDTKQTAFRDGFVTTLLGRRRPLPDIRSRIPQLVATAERMAINHPIQGTGADLMKIAMIRVAEFLRRSENIDKVRMLLQVHDELVLEVVEGATASMAAKISEIMEGVYKLDVPLVVDAKAGDTWADMKRISHA